MVGVGVGRRGGGGGRGREWGGGGAGKGYVTVQHPVGRLVEVHLATLRHVRSEGDANSDNTVKSVSVCFDRV